MKSLQLRTGATWTAPALLLIPFLLGANGGGCVLGGTIPIGGDDDGGRGAAGGSGPADACVALPCVACPYGSTGIGKDANGCDTCPICAPPHDAASSCECGSPPPTPICVDGSNPPTTCEPASAGSCNWVVGSCPISTDSGGGSSETDSGSGTTDACLALPCVACPYGSTGIGKDANGCDTCPICAPPPDAASSCECGAPPPTPICADGSSPPLTCEPASAGSCNWVVGRCPPSTDSGSGTTDACLALPCVACPYGSTGIGKDANGCDTCPICAPAPDAGASACSADADCPVGEVCGFLESNGCGSPGKCFPAPSITCDAYLPGCACDGSEVDLICNGLPSDYARKPIRHTGLCVDGG
jgi:hypothetical protein